MSGSPGKVVPEINLDEFEKRLRAAGAPSAGERRPAGGADPAGQFGSCRRPARCATRRSPQPPHASRARPAMTPPASFRRRTPTVSRDEADYAAEDAAAGAGILPSAAPRAALARLGLQGDRHDRRRRRAARRRRGVEARRAGLAQGAAVHRRRRRADQGPAAERGQRPDERRHRCVADEGFRDADAGQGRQHAKSSRSICAPRRSRRRQRRRLPPVRRAPSLQRRRSPSTPARRSRRRPTRRSLPPAAASASVAPLFPVAKPVKTVSVRPDGTLIAAADATPRRLRRRRRTSFRRRR